jgi:hypothetical protein
MSGNGDGMHTTRDCIVCGRKLDREGWCSKCERASTVTLCRHRNPLPAWRVSERWRGHRGNGKTIAIAVGEVTVFTDGSGAPTRAREVKLRQKLRNRKVSRLELGMDSFGAMALIAVCPQCDRAFFLPDVQDARKPLRIASVPLRERMTVLLQSSV